MLKPECADLIRNSARTAKSSKEQPSCFFTAEVRAIYNDTAMAYPGCPDGVLKVNENDLPLSMRVEAVEHFQNFVCFAVLPTRDGHIKSIDLEGHNLPVPKWNIEKIVVIGDTGCRLGPSHAGLYQSCLNPSL